MSFIALAIATACAAVLFVPAIRRPLISTPLMRRARGFMPRMGDTERIALEAGTVWWDGDLFSGKPDWNKLLAFKPQPLTERERLFLEGPVEELCRMTDDWQVAQDRDLSPAAWQFIKVHGFFGMVIPERFGGLGFSAAAHSAVVAKIASRSIAAACIVMVPNSLGPAELLLHYGTDAQRDHYLPRLAKGDDIPCFALTEPHAGSDAAASRSTGTVCRGMFNGQEVLGLRLTFDKRYITLAPVATVIGLAFDLRDPQGLLGGPAQRGITCALIPRDTPGLDIGRRHDPMGVPFPNGPITGRDIFVPLDCIIGGTRGVGHGWRMLMECLAAGRSISLPALSVAAAEVAVRITGAYATVREQFGTAIGRFEGIEEPLARIAGHCYLMEAARRLTCGAVDAGEKPAVLSGIVKAYLTDRMRASITDAMDITAGAGICKGPRNLLGRIYAAAPIAITVEGANILTRSLIIFGQGSIRCHPLVRLEMQALEQDDAKAFDRLMFRHAGFIGRNAWRSLAMALTGARFAGAPVNGPAAHYCRKLTRYSSAFALITDAALLTLGGSLKRREKISGRLADGLAWMYLASAALKRFHDEGSPAVDEPLLRWSGDLALWNIQQALGGVIDNLPNRPAAWILRGLVFPLGKRIAPPGDTLGADVARAILDGGDMRRRLTRNIFVPPPGEPGLGQLEDALRLALLARPAAQKLAVARRDGRLAAAPPSQSIEQALALKIVDQAEAHHWMQAEQARDSAIAVDAFSAEDYRNL